MGSSDSTHLVTDADRRHFLDNQNLAGSSSTRRKLNEVLIRESGFSRRELIISEGENVAFSVSNKKSTDPTDDKKAQFSMPLGNVSLQQVVEDVDEESGSYRPVIGGYQCKNVTSRVTIKFKVAGEYMFVAASGDNSSQYSPPIKIIVVEEQPVSLLVNEEGFLPKIIRVEEGTSIQWSWAKLSAPLSIHEAEYCDTHGTLVQSSKRLVTPATSSSYRRRFDEPGVYYFQSESKALEHKHMCVVEVMQSYREHSVEILDNKFNPGRITIEEGDRVWFHWNKDRCSKRHCIYQIHPPSPDHAHNKAYLPVKNGFQWTSPTRNGMLCHQFNKCGVYYFGDMNNLECASYIGIIAVKKKPKHVICEFSESNKRFEQEVINSVESGDLIWWKWNKSNSLAMNLIETQLLFDKKVEREKCKIYSFAEKCEEQTPGNSTSSSLARSGVYSYKIKNAGCYYFRVFNGLEQFTVTVVATAAEKDHKIAISDTEAKPPILNIHPQDRVWFVWDEAKRPQNIRQVNHHNQLVSNGFVSGALMESPATFVQTFEDLGIFYYRSDNVRSILGAVVVVHEPSIRVVQVNENGPSPDPIVVHSNDLVIWQFDKYQAYDLRRVKTEKDFYDYAQKSREIVPRRFLSRAFRDVGVYHFVSPSFDNTVDVAHVEKARAIDNIIISTVIVDKMEDYTTVLLDSKGFYPELVNVEQHKSVLFDWRDTNEAHNIIHMSLPNDKSPLRRIEGPTGFTSGRPVINNSFLHTFDEEGIFCVISEASSAGNKPHYCLVNVMRSADKTETPALANPNESMVLYKYAKVFLQCDTNDAKIHYTTDGSMPSKKTASYDYNNGILMSDEGINIIRAIAYSDKRLNSDVFTSHRFYVVPDPESQNPPLPPQDDQDTDLWWQCIPKIQCDPYGVGCIEISWTKASKEALSLISHYQIFLNEVSYRNRISPTTNRVLVKGLAGGRKYDIVLMVYPKNKAFLPQQSNMVTVKSHATTNLGGPVISLKENARSDQITVTWQSIDSPKCPISFYELIINDEKRDTVQPAPGRHRITIEGCKPNQKYSILLVAMPKDGGIPLISNELIVMLPLDLSEIKRPHEAVRKLDPDFYDEYIEIVDAERSETPTAEINDAKPEQSENLPEKQQEVAEKPPKQPSYPSYDNYLIINKYRILSEIAQKSYEIERIQQQIARKEAEKNELEEEDARLILSVRSSEADPVEDDQSRLLKNLPNYERDNTFTFAEQELRYFTDPNIIYKESPNDPSSSELPAPEVKVTHIMTSTLSIEWHMLEPPPPQFILTHFVVTLVGNEFSGVVRSDASYECLMEINGKKLPAVQHCWVIKNGADNTLRIDSLSDSSVYQIVVNAVYKLIDSKKFTEFKKASRVVIYTPMGPPAPPGMMVTSVDIQSATLEWSFGESVHSKHLDSLTGYRLQVNGEDKQTFDRNCKEFLFTDMQPGKNYDLSVVSITDSLISESGQSNVITLVCPKRPYAPLISAMPTTRPRSAMIAWKPVEPRSSNYYDQILFYRVFVNDKYHGEIHTSASNSYTYLVSGLESNENYEVFVQAFSGERLLHERDGTVACIVASESSNRLSLTPAAPPDAVRIKLVAISSEGLDLTWPFPQQYGDASVSGFQLVKNGRLCGAIIPPETSIYKLTDVQIGETVDLQLISLTNHPVGKYYPNNMQDSSKQSSRNEDDRAEIVRKITHPDYPACKIGPVLTVKYTNLVKPAVKIWTEKVTGYSAMVAFKMSKMNHHFIEPEYYVIRCWPGTIPGDGIQEIRTDNEFAHFNNLKPCTIYTVQVESRCDVKKSEFLNYPFYSYSLSNMMQFQTASPPDPPTNLTVVSTTCHAIKICWDPPISHGSELVAIRIDCYQLNEEKPIHIYKELTPDAKTCIIDNLSEKSNYKISVTAITEEYFVNHKIKELKQLPRLILDQDMPWLPSASVEAMTSGTDAACQLEWKSKTNDRAINLSWKPAKVYGTNRLVNQVLCFQELDTNNVTWPATRLPLPANIKSHRLTDLKVGSKYKIWIETAVLIRLNIDSDTMCLIQYDLKHDHTMEEEEFRVDHYKELKDTRCTNVISEAVYLRVPAPCQPVTVLLSGYTNNTIDIYWAKPNLHSQHKDPDNPERKWHLYRHLIGYRLEVNGIRQRSIAPNDTICTLTKCRPGNTYNIVIVALTCLSSSAVRTDKQGGTESEVDINEIDESYSEPLQVKIFHAEKENQLHFISGQYESISTKEDVPVDGKASNGRIVVEWASRSTKGINGYNLHWYTPNDSKVHNVTCDSNTGRAYIPVHSQRCIYEIWLEVLYDKARQSVFRTERLFIEVPGAPDAPELWLKEQLKDANQYTIQWTEPRVYAHQPVAGYQIYLNDEKVGNRLDKDVLSATLPLKPNRSYKINVQALSNKAIYRDSEFSNNLQVNTSLSIDANQFVNPTTASINPSSDMAGGSGVGGGDFSTLNYSQVVALRLYYEQENETSFNDPGEQLIPLRVSKVTEDYVDLDWSRYNRFDPGINEFKIQWHCLNTNEHFEHRCGPNVTNFRLKRLRSGFTYCVKVMSIKNTNTIVSRSKNVLVQVTAAPDSPRVKLRASNFKYVSIEWNKPACYGNANIVAYKVYVDGKVEAVLSGDQHVFTLSKGEACREYTFQVQAMTSEENLSSPLSSPLKVVWPGIKLPHLRMIERDHSGLIRIGWNDPSVNGQTKISFYRCIAESLESGQVVTVGPIEASKNECDFVTLDSGRYKISLEVNTYGSAEPLISSPIYVDCGHKPDAPHLTAQVFGLEERKKLDRVAASLANKRDRLLLVVGRESGKDNVTLSKAMSTLRQLEDTLNDCLKMLAHYSGYFIVNLSWTCQQSSSMVKVLGFRVFINGQQYGVDLHESIRTIRVKLTLEKAIHSIYVTAFTDQLQNESQDSNVIELLSENFFPFSYYCYNNVHHKNKSWPEKGCCAYQDSLSIERSNLAKTRDLIHHGLLDERVSVQRTDVYDLLSKRTRPMIDRNNKLSSTRPTVVLFWTKWCLASIRLLNYFVMFSRQFTTHAEFVACHTGNENNGELVELLRKAGYLDTNVKFVVDIKRSIEPNQVSCVEQFEVKGVPTICIVNQHGQLAWRGRYCAYEFSYFEGFMQHAISEVSKSECQVVDCELCYNDLSIEREINEIVNEQKNIAQYSDAFAKPSLASTAAQDDWTGLEIMRRSVPRLPKISTKQLIGVVQHGAGSGSAVSLGGGASGQSHRLASGKTPTEIQLIRSYNFKKKPVDGFCHYTGSGRKTVKRHV